MSKQILIVGGGISGLTVLHYLKVKYANRKDVEIKLLERASFLGGTIRTIREDGFAFECGPNGFLASKPSTLELISELGLNDSLVSANAAAKRRFICLAGILNEIPLGPKSFLFFKPFSLKDKLRVLAEIAIPKGKNPNETIYEFGTRRLGKNFAELFLDPMVSGVFGGDCRKLHLKSAFPRIHEIEQTYGSLFKGAIALALKKKKTDGAKRLQVEPKGVLTSFRAGMSELIETLGVKYRDSIRVGEEVESLKKVNSRFILQTKNGEYSAEEVFLSAPAYVSGSIIFYFNKLLAEELRKIPYAPMAVVGLVYKKSAFVKTPEGFGYLIPSRENRSVLGALFSSNIFEGRAKEDYILLQVMIGGARHPEIASTPKDELLKMARTEIQDILQARSAPEKEFFSFWPKAIPQYTQEYPACIEKITCELGKIRGLYLAANYVGGVSVNDCIASARLVAERSNL